jgi:hypothetical protein
LITLVQVRSHGMTEVANGGHVTVRLAVGVGLIIPLRLQPRDLYPIGP